MASQLDWRCVWRGFFWSAFFYASFLLTASGVGALKFLQVPPTVQASHTGWSVDYNCTTDDPNATVSLLHSKDFGFSYNVFPVTPNKLLLRKQVFTIVNLVLADGGTYKCRAMDQSGQTIESNPGSNLFIQKAELPRHFVLIPNKAIYVLQGQSGEVTCEAEGPSVSTLKWEKEQKNKSYAAVPVSQVNITKDDNYVRATLKITNAQSANIDAYIYKCTVSVLNKSDYKLTTIEVIAPSAPLIRPYTGETKIQEGSTKAIKCVTEGAPKPTVNWYRNGKKLNVTNCQPKTQSCDKVDYEVYEEGDGSSRLHSIYTIQVLKIRSALYPRDVGNFTCVASNGISPDAELIVNLDVQVKPTLKERLDAVAVVEGKEAEVSCRVTKSNPLPTFRWQYAFKNLECNIDDPTGTCVPKEDKWVTVPSQFVFPSSSTPTNESIVSVAKDQQNAFYRCQAFNSLGNDSQILKFVRLVKPDAKVEFDTGKTMTEVNEKSTLQLFCIDRFDRDFGLIFSKDGEKIELSDSRVNVTIFENLPKETERLFKLTMKNVTMNDTGEYGCTLSDLFPKLLDAINVTVKALKAPNITKDIPNVTVLQGPQGVNVELFCDVTGNPEPSIMWYFYKDGKGDPLVVNGHLSGNKGNCRSRTKGYYFLQPDDARVLVICNPEFDHHQGKYLCRAENTVGWQNKSAFVNVEMAPVIVEPKEGDASLSLTIGEPLNISCVAKGNPAPNVTWFKNNTGKAVSPTSTNSQRLIIKSIEDKDFGVYICIASNKYLLKDVMVSVEIKKEGSINYAGGGGLSTGTLVGIAIGVSVFVLIVLVVCCCLYHRQKKQIDEYKQLYFLQTSSDYKIDPDRSLLEQCSDLPYDPDWEFPEERLILGNVLGAGAFGQVVKAEAIGILALNARDKSAESFKRRSKIRRSSRAKDLKDGGSGWKNVKVPVAVKTLKEGATQAEYKDLASELKILIHLGQHKNIINLLGACTKGKRLLVVMEFAPHGSLLNFLRARRDTFDASWTKTMNDPEKEFTLVDLVMIGFQVGRGMSFLASKKCVHRDLAARNILVGDDYVMKIADFGLARDIYKDDQYVKNTQGLLPVKWMAPESLFDRVYTEKTDVWSFGILLWETFTLGGAPYPGLPTEQLLDYLSDGKRMDMPAKCPLEVYTVMRDCWIHEPEQRPHFTTLTERLAQLLEKHTTTDNPYLALQMDEEVQPSSGYYLQPVDNAGFRDSKRYVKSPLQSPTSDTEEPPQFGGLEGDGKRYDSPLPTLPPGLPALSDDEIPTEPLPPLPPPYENDIMDKARFPERADSAGGESGIDMDGADDGYVEDVRADTPFVPPPGNKPVAIDMKAPEPKVLWKGSRNRIETSL